jgi:hypothetical protein
MSLSERKCYIALQSTTMNFPCSQNQRKRDSSSDIKLSKADISSNGPPGSPSGPNTARIWFAIRIYALAEVRRPPLASFVALFGVVAVIYAFQNVLASSSVCIPEGGTKSGGIYKDWGHTSLGIEWRIDTEVDCKYGFPCINGEVVGTIVGSVAESLREACKE